MLCESIRPVTRAFLDDLLDENDYQDIQAHLARCERCRAYASSVGTLSYRLYELGQVSVPPDMSSTILYNLEKPSHSALTAPTDTMHQDKSAKDMAAIVPRLFQVAVLLISAATVIVVAAIMSHHRIQKEENINITTPVFAPESGFLGTTIPVSALDNENPKETIRLWHYHISRSSQSELKQICQDLSLAVLDESPSHLIFDVSKEKLGEFTNRIAGLSGVVDEYGEMDPSNVTTNAIQISIYLE
jgi:hypothetical protein